MRSMQSLSTGRAAVRGMRSPAATAEADRRHGWEMLRSIWQFRHVCLWVYGGGCGRADTRRPLFTGGDRRRSLRVGGPSSRELSGPIGGGESSALKVVFVNCHWCTRGRMTVTGVG